MEGQHSDDDDENSGDEEPKLPTVKEDSQTDRRVYQDSGTIRNGV